MMLLSARNFFVKRGVVSSKSTASNSTIFASQIKQIHSTGRKEVINGIK